MVNYVDKQIAKLKKEKQDIEEKKLINDFVGYSDKKTLIKRFEKFKSIFGENETDFYKLSEYLKKEYGDDIRYYGPKSGRSCFQIWLQIDNRLVDIIDLSIWTDNEIQVRILDPKSSSILDEKIVKKFKIKENSKAFKYFIDTIVAASKRI